MPGAGRISWPPSDSRSTSSIYPTTIPRLAVVADAYTTREWGTDRFPTAMLDGWLANLAGSGESGIPNDPDEFVTAWLDAERRAVYRTGRAG